MFYALFPVCFRGAASEALENSAVLILKMEMEDSRGK